MHARDKQTNRSSKCSLGSSCVKIYLCSNPEDSVVERRALRESVFPKLREHCRHTLGLDVRVIDPFESRDPTRWPNRDTRQQLIKECRESSAGPFLLALVGHQYGAACLPTHVEASEFQLLLQESQQAGISTQELERVYGRDENAAPPSYCLRQRCRPQRADVEEDEEVQTEAKEDELRKVFQATASLCVHRGLMTAERALRYNTSALDADLRFALCGRPVSDVVGRCLVYVHKVVNVKGEREKRPTSGPQPHPGALTFDTDSQLFSRLFDDFLPGLITSSQLVVYTTTTECDPRHGYTTARRRCYAESLCLQVHADLVGLIKAVNVSGTRDDTLICDALAREEAEQEELCDLLSGFYDVIRPEEEKIRAYVEQNEHQLPLVVTGGPCTGKAVLLAHCAQQIKSWLPDCDPVVITCFCNLSINPFPKQLLSSLCYQIAGRYHHSLSPCDQNPSDRDDPRCRDDASKCSLMFPPAHLHESSSREQVPDCNLLSSLLSILPSTKQPLFLILDGLDHIQNDFGSQIIGSLPSPLPPCVKVILAASSNRAQVLQVLSPLRGLSVGSGQGSGYVRVPLGTADRKQCLTMLAALLHGSGRTVTSGQQALVNQALTSCCLTLYTRLLHLHTSLWHSDSDVNESSLPNSVHSSISCLLDHLEQKHGSSVVSRAVSYLTLSRTGLTEAELADLLSSDEEVMSEYVWWDERSCPNVRVPQVDVERLLLDLRRFLMKRTVARLQVLFWVSRHFKLVVTKRYLGTLEMRSTIHSAMADYFSGRWGHGSAKPLLKNLKSSSSKDPIQMALYIDRQPSSQPFLFASCFKEVGHVNFRKLLELPHHLRESNKWEELECGLLMSLGFHQAMVRAGLLEGLVAILESEEWSSRCEFLRERALIARILKSSSCLLRSSPLQLPTVMETSLLPYLEVFPALSRYIGEIREERKKRGSGLGVALCPAPSSVPIIQRSNCGDHNREVSVREVAAAECGIVAEIMEDSTAWFWKGPGCEVAELSLSCEQKEMKFVGVKSSAQFMLLYTQCNKLFLWDMTGPEMFLQLHDSLKSYQQAPNEVAGFVASRRKLFLWWKDESSVSAFDVSHETVTHIHCQSCVTYVVCSSDGFYMYCGQVEGTVSIFDTDTGSLLGTWSNSNHHPVMWMVLCEDKREVVCVDRTGNVSVWDVAAGTHQPRLVTQSFNGGDFTNVLSADYADEICTLLVCQPHQVSLWATCDWELWDQFLAPQGRAFAHAVLSQDGHLFLALLDGCSLVLVWRVSTGECVLSLETNKQPKALLKTSLDIICVAHDGCLTAWDTETIDAAGAALKMGFGVKEVAVDQTDAWFYTADGSEMVWRWRSETGLPHAHFLHEGPVKKLCLSPDSIHLVTLSAEDIYVWQTETGQNIVRVSGSRATNILITPNSKFGVSISEQRLSQVWKLAQGSIVCSIHLYLSDAQVMPEGTFLIGCCRGNLLAASLWSGSINKRFSCVASSEHVVAFHTLSEHPDFVVVIGASGAVYTWKVSEETVCRHFQLPHTFHCQPKEFQMSSDGSYALLSTENGAINLLDLSQLTLCSFKAEGPVIKACLDGTGCYVAYISSPTTAQKSCACSLHARPVLTVVRLVDSERIGSVHLSKNPLTLLMSKQRRVFVGFVDGSIGVYSVSDVLVSREESIQCRDRLKKRYFDKWLPLAIPNVKWP